MRLHFTLICIIAFAINISSQVFPVSTLVTLTPPYPTSLEGFVDQMANKINLQVIVNDATLANYPVKLRLILKSNSVTITTSPSYIANPVHINGGEVLVLNALELADYFRPENLDFSGYSKSQYLRTGQLPDGIYQISFEVIDYNRSFVISSARMPAFAYIFVNDPPILNLPLDRSQISLSGQQNIVFNWSFRHSPFSRPGFVPEYLFEMWEVYPENIDPYAISLSTQPVYTKTIKSTTFNYSIMEPMLIAGRKYAWRVTAQDPDGITAFKEKGKSELRWFQYGVACDAPEIKENGTGPQHISIEWETPQYQSSYTIKYRPVQQSEEKWYSASSTLQSYKISQLRPNTEYYVEVTGTCSTQESPASDRLTIRTKQDLAFECGKGDAVPQITNQTPLMQLKRGDYIKAGDFEVEIYTATGSNGTYSGKGFVLVPLFNFLKLEADLNNIKVNTDYQLIGGSIKTIYNINNSLTLNLTNLFDTPDQKPEENPFIEIADIKVDAPNEINNVVISGNSVVVSTSGGNITQPLTDNKLVVVTAPSGQQYVVDGSTKTVYTQGTPMGTAPSSGADNLKQASGSQKKFSVTFGASDKQLYGFDNPETQNIPANNYKTKAINGQTVNLPWKSVESGRFDRMSAVITGDPADSVFFSRDSRKMVMVSNETSGNARSLLVTGDGNEDEDELYAWYTYKGIANDTSVNKEMFYAGAMNLVSYDKIEMNICLVGVNGSAVPADKNAVQEYLNKVFAPAIVKCSVTVLANGLNVTLANGSSKKIDNTDPDSRMDYTPDMQLVNKVMKEHTAYNNQTIYLFFFDQATDAALTGYMPFKGQFGYIYGYTAGNEAKYYRSIAHESAHGAFRLRHTFSPENDRPQPRGQTTNLMDYAANTATNLYKYQWDNIHDPENMLFVGLQDEGEGAYISETFSQEVARFINYIKCAKVKGSPTAEIHHGWNSYEVKIGSLISLLNHNGSGTITSTELSNAKLRVTVSHGYGSEPNDIFVGYQDITLNVNQAQYTTQNGLNIPANKGGMYFSAPTGTSAELKTQIFNWLQKECGLTGSQPTTVAVNNSSTLEVKDVFLFSVCELEQINRSKRETLVRELMGNQEDWAGLDKDTYQYLLLNLLKTTPAGDKAHFYNLFKDNPKWLSFLYGNMATAQRDKLMKILIELWYNNYSGNVNLAKSEAKNAFIVTNSIFGNASNYLGFSAQGEVIFTVPQIQVSEYMATESNEEVFRTAPFEPVFLGIEGDNSDKPFTVLPAICIKYYTDKGNMANMKEALMLTANAALFAVGVGEVVTGVRGAILVARTTGVASTKFLGSCLRISLGVADLAASITSSYCNGANSSSEFCQTWKEYEFYINMGLLTASVSDMLYTKLSNSYTTNVKSKLNGEQVDFIENELGITVRITNKNFTTLIDDKIKILPQEGLFGNQAKTFLNSEYVNAETLQEINTYRRFGGDAKLRGSYVSTKANLTRDELALVKDFNNSMRFEAVIKIPKGEKLAVGKVGPWPPTAPEFMGGADQVIISRFDFPENAWVESIKDFETGKIYTYGEFRLKFPNLCVK